jgi:hypothetical protein
VCAYLKAVNFIRVYSSLGVAEKFGMETCYETEEKKKGAFYDPGAGNCSALLLAMSVAMCPKSVLCWKSCKKDQKDGNTQRENGEIRTYLTERLTVKPISVPGITESANVVTTKGIVILTAWTCRTRSPSGPSTSIRLLK